MPSTDWRSPVAYGHARSIPAAGFAWEYLRRDDDYRRDFEQFSALPKRDTGMTDAFSRRWGVRFPGCSGNTGRRTYAVLDTGAATRHDPARADRHSRRYAGGLAAGPVGASRCCDPSGTEWCSYRLAGEWRRSSDLA
ncbi:transcriptional regulator domain-containing protein [Ancylobacter lacus]|nr:DUF6499 domain-containing protein [Ancylobacter lacus]